MSDEPTRVAVVGVGHMGRHHARLYHELPQANLVAIVDSKLDQASEYARKFKSKAFSSIDQIPDSVQAVSVAVPTVFHRQIATDLLRRGMAVLVEKPLAPSIEDAEEILACAKETGCLLTVGHTERFSAVAQAVSRLNLQPRYIEAQRVSPFRFRSADIGVVADMMIHDIDIVLSMVRSPIARVDAIGVNVLAKHEDVANARVLFESGVVANFAASRLALKTDRRLRVFSETSYLSLDFHRSTGVVITRDANLDILALAKDKNLEDLGQMANLDFGKMVKVEPLVLDDVEPLRAELESFLHSVQTQTAPRVTAEDGVAAVRLASRIVEAIKAHRWTA